MISLYFDPGTGALIVQLLVAVGASVVLFYNRIVSKIKSIFKKNDSNDNLYEDIDIVEEEKNHDKE